MNATEKFFHLVHFPSFCFSKPRVVDTCYFKNFLSTSNDKHFFNQKLDFVLKEAVHRTKWDTITLGRE